MILKKQREKNEQKSIGFYYNEAFPLAISAGFYVIVIRRGIDFRRACLW